MADAEEKREAGASLMFAGLAVWVAGLLVLFYLPAATRIGYQGRFGLILGGLAILGAILMARGWSMRRGTSE
jgi:phosphatidylserine synthase